jgi:hypothetical protein
MISEKMALLLSGAGSDTGGCESDDGRKGLLGAENDNGEMAVGEGL